MVIFLDDLAGNFEEELEDSDDTVWVDTGDDETGTEGLAGCDVAVGIVVEGTEVAAEEVDDDPDGEGESGDLMLSKLLDKVSNPTLLALLSFSSLFLSVMSLEALSSDSFDFSLASDDAFDAGFTPSLAVWGIVIWKNAHKYEERIPKLINKC